MQQHSLKRCILGLALIGVAMLVGAATVLAAGELTQKAGTAGCISETGSGGTCQEGRGIGGAAAVALSPDGEYAYVASSSGDGIAILTRDQDSGLLGQIPGPASCWSNLGGPECLDGRRLDGADDVAVSPDGRSVYVAAPGEDAVAVFSRSLATDELSQAATAEGCVVPDEFDGCDVGRGLEGATALVVGPDGKQVYVATTSGTVATFDRHPTTGRLTQPVGTAGCINEGGSDECADGNAQTLGAQGIEISPDGKAVYVASPIRNAVTVYDRNLETGELTQKPGGAGCVNEDGSGECQDGKALLGANSLALSPDGTSLYVGARTSDAIAVFDRDTTTNELTQKPGTVGCVSETGRSDPSNPATEGACLDGTALDEVASVTVLPGGGTVYGAAREGDALSIFDRDPGGVLVQKPGAAGCVAAFGAGGCQAGRGLLAANDVVAAGDAANVYAAAIDSSAISVFDAAAPPPEEPPNEPPAAIPPSTPVLAPESPIAPRVLRGKGPKAVVKTRKARATVRFNFSADVAAASFRCKLDAGIFKACRSPVTIQVKPGRHTFTVQAALGGLQSAPATFVYKVKRLPPRRS